MLSCSWSFSIFSCGEIERNSLALNEFVGGCIHILENDCYNVPIATNLASAEMFIMGLQRGDLDWREMLHSKPRY